MTRILIIIFLLSSILCSQEADNKTKIDEYLKRAQEVWGFQGTVLIARSDKIIYEKAYGMANLENNQPNTISTKFLIGSVTKSFTAIAIMQLVEKGILKIDQPITSYLKDYPAETGDKITIRHLLSHTSGIPVFSMLPDFRTKAMLSSSVDDIVNLFKDEPLLFEPGSKQQYGSPGYLLLGIIIENATGLTYQEYIRRYITEPSGMFGTDIVRDYRTRPDFATGYHRNPNGQFVIAEPLLFPIAFSAGGLSSTAHDMHLLDRALNGNSLLNPNSLEFMLTSEINEYGHGFNIRNLEGHIVVGHDGSAPGFCATFQRWLDDSLCIIVLCNNANLPLPPYSVADGLAAILLKTTCELPRLKSPTSMDINALVEYEGVYQEDNGEYHVIGLVGHRLAERNNAGIIKPIIPEAKDKFYYEQNCMTTLVFSRDTDENIIQYALKKTFDGQVMRKINKSKSDSIACKGSIVSIPVSILKRYTGVYQFTPDSPNWNVFIEEDKLYAQVSGLPSIELLPLSIDIFCIRSLGAEVIFSCENEKRVTGLSFVHQGVTNNARKIDKKH